MGPDLASAANDNLRDTFVMAPLDELPANESVADITEVTYPEELDEFISVAASYCRLYLFQRIGPTGQANPFQE